MNHEQLSILLSALADEIMQKNRTILLQEYEIKDLKEKVKKLEPAKEEEDGEAI